MKKYYMACWIVLAVTLSHAETSQIYKWTDSNGQVHFSDKPQPGAEEIQLPKMQGYSVPKIPATEQPSELIQPDIGHYDTIRIAQPDDQLTIRNTQGYVSVILEIKPKLKVGDKVQILVDGSPIGDPQEATVFALRDINRGSHTIAAQILDAKGQILNTSDSITIFMMPPRVGMVHKSP